MVAIKDIMLLIGVSVFTASSVHGQCETWNTSPRKDEAENAHSNYRSALKMKDNELAFTEWNKAYEIAPAADGMRDFHYMDGIKLYKEQLKSADEATKGTLKEAILRLYDECAACYEAEAIKLTSCSDGECYKRKAAQVRGRKAFDMYYELNSPYEPNLEAFKASLSAGPQDVEYIIFEPTANIIVYQFQKEKINAETARDLHEQLVDAADVNIEANGQYKAYYESAKARMLAKFSEIESDIFDCDYFKSKLEPQYNEKPDDPDVVKYVYNKLLQEGCDKTDPLLAKLKTEYERYAEGENSRIQAEFEANNPGVVANRLYREGDFEGAIDKYATALEGETDPDKRAQYYFNIASIEFRKLGRLQSARSSALKAAELRSGWGQPYLLIGDIYAKAAKSCGGDAWGQRIVILAALDKYLYARSIDGAVQEEANRKIGIYSSNKPSKDDAFMRGFKAGQEISTGCWIAERTILRVQ
ncbi:MAG: hypothetical protein OEQ53_17495 [Saprospiraceae bacterium]|nr:hypothetical protein [Saprospiraceae bacterium]